MRIAMITPYVSQPTPGRGWSPHLTVTHALGEALLRRGHEVVLYATKDSTFSGELRWRHETGQAKRIGRAHYEHHLWSLSHATDDGFDVIHSHAPHGSVVFYNLGLATPQVQTHHAVPGAAGRRVWGALRKVLDPAGSIHDVSLSRAHGKACARGLAYTPVHHGLPVERFSPRGDGRGGYLATLSRISAEKGIHHAIRAAKLAGLPLKIAGVPLGTYATPYFEQVIEPHLGRSGIEYVGHLQDHEEKLAFLSNARALLNPIRWDEPFGLSTLESMLCGTPVISYARGSAPELIADGVSGFLVGSVREMVDATRRVDALDRDRVRRYAIEHFSDDRMAGDYEALYRRIVSDQQARPASDDERHGNRKRRELLDQLANDEALRERLLAGNLLSLADAVCSRDDAAAITSRRTADHRRLRFVRRTLGFWTRLSRLEDLAVEPRLAFALWRGSRARAAVDNAAD